jgi:uncharacterized 2Fe-2S/4Fe-4S cluster protein (DUF4445 family)
MLPDVADAKIRQVGNAAGIGAKQALISGEKRKEAQVLCVLWCKLTVLYEN